MQRNIGMLIKQISDQIRVEANAFHKKYGLTFSQAQVLYYLYTHDGTATQKELEVYLGVSHPAVAGLVSRLSDAGFLICRADESDRRSKILCITERARTIETQMRRDRASIEAQMCEGLSPQELEELYRLLRVLAQNITKENRK